MFARVNNVFALTRVRFTQANTMFTLVYTRFAEANTMFTLVSARVAQANTMFALACTTYCINKCKACTTLCKCSANVRFYFRGKN